MHAPCGTDFDDAWTLCRNNTMISAKFASHIYNAVRYLNRRRIDGDILEAGVWRGGASCVMACAQLQDESYWPSGSRSARHFWLLDTFDGMYGQSANDGPEVATGVQALAEGRMPDSIIDSRWVEASKWNYAPENVVRLTMRMPGLSPSRVHLVKGPVETTLDSRHMGSSGLPPKLALVRLDTDWYASTLIELQALWPKLEPGGWLFVDDYFTWPGAKKAVDEWVAEHNWTAAAQQAHAFGLDARRRKMRNLVGKSRPYSKSVPFRKYRSGVP